jgi:hypothetical protein
MEQFHLLYERFLDCGYTPQLFYELSINETIDMINSFERRRERRQKEEFQALIPVLDMFGSNLIEKVMLTLGMMTGNRDNGGLKFSMLQYFPDLFLEGVDQTGEAARKDDGHTEATTLSAEMQLYKAQRIQHVYHVNQNRNRKENVNGK